MSTFIRESLSGDLSHIPQGVRDGKGTEFIPANFPKRFPHDLHVEEGLGIVPPKWKTTQKLDDPPPPRNLRVKSGYTGHVPHGRDYIGGTYRSHDNRGTATKYAVPVVHRDGKGDYPIPTKPIREQMENRMLYHDPFNSKKGDHQHEYGVRTTAPVPIRVEKVLSGDTSDISDEQNAQLMADETDSKQLHGGQRDMGGAGTWVMAGYTGHIPKSRELYGTSFYGPPEGNSYHGPYYASDAYAQPSAPNKEAICP